MKQHYVVLIFLCLLGTLRAQRVVTVGGTFAGIAYVPARDALFGVRPASDDSGNTLCRIDPVTGTILASYPIGDNPHTVVATTSGDYLYVGFLGENRIRRFDIANEVVDLDFSLGGEEDAAGPFFAEEILPIRGSDDLVAVSLQNSCCYPRQAGVALYEMGRLLPVTVPANEGSNSLAYTDLDEVILGYKNEAGGQFWRIEVGEYGLTATPRSENFEYYNGSIEYADGLIYADDGQIATVRNGDPIRVDAVSLPELFYVGTLAVEPVPEADLIYYLGKDDGFSLMVVDAASLTVLQVYSIGRPNEDYTNLERSELVSLGSSDALAYMSNYGTLLLITLCTSTIAEAPPPYDRPASICYGATLQLIASAGARTVDQSIVWSDGQIGDTVTITQAGLYSYRVADANGCPGPSSPLFYVGEQSYPTEAPYLDAAETTVVCENNSVTIRAEYYYGSSIVWNTGDTTSALVVTEGGDYFAYGIESETGCPSEVSAPITITAVSEPGPSAPIVDQGTTIDTCTTGGVEISVSQPAQEYYWEIHGAYTYEPGSNWITLYPYFPTTFFTVRFKDFNGCMSPTTSGTVTFLPVPETPYIQYNQATATLASSARGPHLWYYQDELEAETTGRYYQPKRNGFYSAQLKGTNCPSNPSNLVGVGGITTSIKDDVLSRQVLVYPNPAHDVLHVNFDPGLAAELPRGLLNYQLYRAGGALMGHGTLDPRARSDQHISVANLTSGVYLLTFTTHGKAVLRKRITVI